MFRSLQYTQVLAFICATAAGSLFAHETADTLPALAKRVAYSVQGTVSFKYFGYRSVADVQRELLSLQTVADSLINNSEPELAQTSGLLEVRFSIQKEGHVATMDILESRGIPTVLEQKLVAYLGSLQFPEKTQDWKGSTFLYRLTYRNPLAPTVSEKNSVHAFEGSPMTRQLLFQSGWLMPKARLRYTQKDLTHAILEYGITPHLTIQANTDFFLLYSTIMARNFKLNGGLALKAGYDINPWVHLSGALSTYYWGAMQIALFAPNLAATIGTADNHVTIGLNRIFIDYNDISANTIYIGGQYRFSRHAGVVAENSIQFVRTPDSYAVSSFYFPVSNGAALRLFFNRATVDLGCTYNIIANPGVMPYLNLALDLK